MCQPPKPICCIARKNSLPILNTYKMDMKKLALLLGCSLSVSLAMAQNVEFVKENFAQNKDGFKEAKKRLDEGNDIFAATSKKTDDTYRQKFYKDAVAPYLGAYALNPNNAL